METAQKYIYKYESQAISPISDKQALSPVSDNGFPILAIAILGIMATGFILVSYYIFVTKCCFNWQHFDPLRRFSIRRRWQDEDPLTAYSPSCQSQGIDEVLIRGIPTLQYSRSEGDSSTCKCVVCLNEFQEHDLLRVLPKCNHAFHLDCIDVWLQTNANCPLCRSTISGRNRYRLEKIVAPNSSPQDPQPFTGRVDGNDEDFVVIELSGGNGRGMSANREQERSESRRNLVQSRSHSSRKLGKTKPRKSHHVSIMGDECINVREKDDQFSIQPIRRSFSMDSAGDRHVFLSVQEILQQNTGLSETRNNEESSSRSRRSIFSLGHRRGSSSVLPVEF